MRDKFLLAWLALCIFFITLRVGALSGLESEEADSLAYAPGDQEDVPGGHYGPQDGGRKAETSPAVLKALRILQPLQHKNSRASSYDKNSGALGTTLYYAKEAFYLLFMNGPPIDSLKSSRRRLSQPLSQAVTLLENAAEKQEPDAIFLLAEMNFYGNYTFPRNYTEAFHRYHDLASLNGNSSAQHMLGFIYATGLGSAVERDQAKALMYHTFAAMGGSTKSQMTAAYRHHTGVGTPRNCNQAAHFYKKVADKAVAYARSGPPGGHALGRDSYKIADEDGGVYGEGASVISSGMYANRAGPNSDANADLDDVLEYLDLMSRKGDLKATFSLGKLHYEGQREMKRNLRTARAYFMIVARKYWQKDGSVRDEDQGIAKIASKAAGYIGKMFLRGEGMETSYEKALTWFRRGVKNGDVLCQYWMGLMHLQGLGVKENALLAAEYFKAAADQDLASANVKMGQLYLDQGNINEAIRFFDLAARHGHIEAFYHLAEINNQGIGRDRSCGMATAYYKLVAEIVEPIHSSFAEANRAYDEGDIETALPIYMMAAEQGYESAQANVAYLLDEYKSIISLDSLIPWKKPRSEILKNAMLALIYWTRSAKQSNIDSMVKMGDYYLGGYGIEADMEKAATCYQTAAETHQSAQALWNLGWIHENGIGVEQDFHLAKRFYDQALETNQESYLPVKLALIKLRARSFWNTMTGGKVNSIRSEPEPRTHWTASTWLQNFLNEADAAAQDGYYPDDDYIDTGMPGGDDDYYDDIDEGIVESFIIVGLMATLAFLVYYRNQRQLQYRQQGGADAAGQAQRQAQGVPPAGGGQALQHVPGEGAAVESGAQREEVLDQQQQADGGFFPPAEDPEFGAWVAGGVGH